MRDFNIGREMAAVLKSPISVMAVVRRYIRVIQSMSGLTVDPGGIHF